MESSPFRTYYSPIWLASRVNSFFDQGIDLDPASDEFANQRIKARKIFTEQDDGLKQRWEGNTVYVFPPTKYKPRRNQFNRDWLERAYRYYQKGSIKEVIFVVYNFQNLVKSSVYLQDALLLITKKPILFDYLDEKGRPVKKKENWRELHCIAYLGKRKAKFNKKFKSLGTIWRQWL